MEYAKNLYMSEEICEKKASKILKKIKKKKRIDNVYFLTCIEESKNPMEILSAEELYKTINRDGKILIVGIANGIKNSFELVRIIYDDVYCKTSGVNLDVFFETS